MSAFWEAETRRDADLGNGFAEKPLAPAVEFALKPESAYVLPVAIKPLPAGVEPSPSTEQLVGSVLRPRFFRLPTLALNSHCAHG